MTVERRRTKIDIDICENYDTNAETMHKVKLQYFGGIRRIVGKIEEDIELTSNITIFQLLGKLADIYGKEFEGEIFDKDRRSLKDDLMITVNKVVVDRNRLVEISLKPNDALALYPIFLGGG